MQPAEVLGQVEFAVLEAVHRGALRSRSTAKNVSVLGEEPAGEFTLHEVLRRCEGEGLLRSRRDHGGRKYELTGAGRRRLRADRRFRLALVRMLARSRR
jgi:DNA-binding PadR family transcriptional regulator